MYSRRAKKENQLKDALASRPEGSFLFSQNVVVEEVLEDIDEAWTVLWQGGPRELSTEGAVSDSGSSDVPGNRVVDTQPKKPSWLNRTWSRLGRWGRKDNSNMVERVFSVERLHSLIPRFPSWADWNDDDQAPAKKPWKN